jgi:hypothetical protein
MTWGPLNLLYRHHLAVGFRHAGRAEEATAELRKVLEIDERPTGPGYARRSLRAARAVRQSACVDRTSVCVDALGESDRWTARGAAGSRRRDEPRGRVDRATPAWRGLWSSRRARRRSRDA